MNKYNNMIYIIRNMKRIKEGMDLVKENALLRAGLTEMKTCISESKDFESMKECIQK